MNTCLDCRKEIFEKGYYNDNNLFCESCCNHVRVAFEENIWDNGHSELIVVCHDCGQKLHRDEITAKYVIVLKEDYYS